MATIKQILGLHLPVMNAAGSLGFAPDSRKPVNWESFGAFITNPISRKPRRPARGQRMMSFPGGRLLHTGHPNPGFSAAVRRFAGRWRRSSLPVIVHLLGDIPDNMAAMIVRLEEIENIIAVEVGLPTQIEAAEALEIIEASTGEHPLIVRIPLTRAEELAGRIVEAGAVAISLGPPRGALPGPQGKLVYGRQYGPSVFPQALQVVDELVARNIPVIGGGGVYTPEQAEAILAAGAIGVQLDMVLWRGEDFSLSRAEEA